MNKIQTLFLICLLVANPAHSKWWGKSNEEKNPFEGMTAKQLREESKKELRNKQYASAAKRLEALESMYPFSDYTESSQMDLIYAYYENEDYPSAAATAERFIHLYPRAERVDYAYYLKGLSNFQQLRGVFAKYLPIDESLRDPGTQTQAYADFDLLIQRFPNSPYKANALQHMIYLRNMFARQELHVSQYYFKRKMYVAAIERANYLVKNFPQSPCVQNALIILYNSNRALGLNAAAEDVMTVYQANYHTDVMPAVVTNKVV